MWLKYDARTRLVDRDAVLEAAPILRGGEVPVAGVVGDAAIVHHDAAVYGLLLQARDAAVQFAVGEPATALALDGDRVAGVQLAGGRIVPCDIVVNAAGGRAAEVASLLGVTIPNAPIRREVLVTEPRQPFMSAAVTFYRPQEGWFNQTLRGELVAGVVDADEPFAMNESSSLRFLGRTARVVLAKAPRLAELRVIRQWAGVYDTTPDKRPLVGEHTDRPGVWSLNGWSGRGMLLAPLSAELLAREITGEGRDRLLASFDANRFAGTDAAVFAADDYYSGYSH